MKRNSFTGKNVLKAPTIGFIFSKGVEFTLPNPAITCSKLTKEKLEQGVKYVRS